jgi:hypothetical protein
MQIMTESQFKEFLSKKGLIENAINYEHHLLLKFKIQSMYKQYVELKQKGEL